MERFLRSVNTFVLIGILIILILIWTKLPQMPPSQEDFIKAKENKTGFQQLLKKIPYVNIRGTIPVNVQNSELHVNVVGVDSTALFLAEPIRVKVVN